jgi:hypothetical protein
LARAPPAPGRLALVQELVNTHDIEERTEGLRTPDHSLNWLLALSLIPRDTAAATVPTVTP